MLIRLMKKVYEFLISLPLMLWQITLECLSFAFSTGQLLVHKALNCLTEWGHKVPYHSKLSYYPKLKYHHKVP